MKRILLASAVLAFSPLVLAAQEPTGAAAPTRSPIIGVFDIARVTAESQMGQELARELQAIQQEIADQRQQKQVELNARSTEVDSLRTELNTAIATLSADEAEARLQVIRTKEREVQAFFEDGQRELEILEQQAQQRANQLQADYQQAVAPLIEAVAEELGIDLIIDGQAVVYVTPDFDISAALITRMDATPAGDAGSDAGR